MHSVNPVGFRGVPFGVSFDALGWSGPWSGRLHCGVLGWTSILDLSSLSFSLFLYNSDGLQPNSDRSGPLKVLWRIRGSLQ